MPARRPPPPGPPPGPRAPASRPSRLPPPGQSGQPPAGPLEFDDNTAVVTAPVAPRPTIVLVVSGSIAAYKAVEVARLLIKGGARVVPVMTRSAREFVGPTTLQGICGERVLGAMFDPEVPGEVHV